MIEIFYYGLIALFLIIISIIDLGTFTIKKESIPSALTTAFIIITLMISQNMVTLIFGALIGLFLLDLRLYDGVAELKAFIIAGTIMPSIYYILFLAFIISIVAIPYKLLIKKSNLKIKEIPLIPMIGISYLITISFILI